MSSPLDMRYVTLEDGDACARRLSVCLPRSLEPVFFELFSILLNPEVWEQGQGGISSDAQVQVIFSLYLQMSGINNMIGAVLPTLLGSIPVWGLPLDGSTYHKDTYPELYAVIDPALKSGDYFTLPNLQQGYTIIQSGDAFQQGSATGSFEHTLTVSELPPHHHAYDPVVTGDLDIEAVGLPQPNAAQIIPLITENTYDTGDGQPFSLMQPSFAMRFFIVARSVSC